MTSGKLKKRSWIGGALLFGATVLANPYPDPNQVPRDAPTYALALGRSPAKPTLAADRYFGQTVLRVDVNWSATSESYQIRSVEYEPSGTETLARRARRADPLGSFAAQLVDLKTGAAIAHASVGTGSEFRKLTRALSFRFPYPTDTVEFRLSAENPTSGRREEVLKQVIDPSEIAFRAQVRAADLETRVLQIATKSPALILNIYAEGYVSAHKENFWIDADRLLRAFNNQSVPEAERFTIQAVFSGSRDPIAEPKNYANAWPPLRTFLSFYYPYWHPFGRWYNVVYPVLEAQYRDGIGLVPYDYPVILVENDVYFGVGNYNELTAIPARGDSTQYLFAHEIGHFFGLNEEYDVGGRTELAFAPGIAEPWSQNITFSPRDPKWKAWVSPGTPLPTPANRWQGAGPYGAYVGGYAQTAEPGKTHKPGYGCVMDRGAQYCPICRAAIADKIRFDLGK